jgi:hypothetical protein
MGTTASTAVISWIVDQMVVSVGPKTFQRRATPRCRRAASSAGSASPPQSALRPAGGTQPSSRSMR